MNATTEAEASELGTETFSSFSSTTAAVVTDDAAAISVSADASYCATRKSPLKTPELATNSSSISPPRKPVQPVTGRVTLIKKRKISPTAQPLALTADERAMIDAAKKSRTGDAGLPNSDEKQRIESKNEERNDDEADSPSSENRSLTRPSYYGCLRQHIPDDWANAMRDAQLFDGALLDSLEQRYYVETQEEPRQQVFPPRENIFYALKRCPLAKVRVVILGQDPYCVEGQAMGLSFSVPRGVSVPPSLQNIYKELASEYGGDFAVPPHGDLTDWADQGVLLLNSSLTVRAKEPGSHAAWEWQEFTDRIVELICQRHQNIVFILWGLHAQNKASKIHGHYKLKAAHPSSKSAENGFFGCVGFFCAYLCVFLMRFFLILVQVRPL